MQLYDYMNLLTKNKKETDNSIDIGLVINEYVKYLISLATSVFVYDDSGTIDTDAIETMVLFQDGVVAKKGSDVIAIPFPYQYDVDVYTNLPFYQRWKELGFANAALGSDSNLEIDKDCVVVRDNTSSIHLYPLILSTASIMAHCDVTIQSYAINMRQTGVFSVSSDNEMKTVEEFYKKIKKGDYGVVTTDGIMSKFTYLPFQGYHANSLTEILNAKNNTLRSFLKIIGIGMPKDKTQAILSDEIENNDILLNMSIQARFKERQKWVEKINNIFDMNMSVKINPILNNMYKEKEETETDGEQNENEEAELEGEQNENETV